jgi:hypothetical protein
MLDHLPLARDEFQCLGHILAELAQSAITATGAGGRHRIDNALSRQMLRPIAVFFGVAQYGVNRRVRPGICRYN